MTNDELLWQVLDSFRGLVQNTVDFGGITNEIQKKNLRNKLEYFDTEYAEFYSTNNTGEKK